MNNVTSGSNAVTTQICWKLAIKCNASGIAEEDMVAVVVVFVVVVDDSNCKRETKFYKK